MSGFVPKGIHNQPVNRIYWLRRDQIKPNLYNPNSVAPPEMQLLKVSIMEDGWTQPVVIYPPVDITPAVDVNLLDFTLIDGFHRWSISGDRDVHALTDGLVPSVIVRRGLDASHRMMSTVRHNRARGTHAVLKMSEIIKFMTDNGMSPEEIIKRLGMEDEEVERLASRIGQPVRFHNQQGGDFNRSWVPKA